MKSLNFKALMLILMSVITLKAYSIDLRPAYIGMQSGGGMGIATIGTGWKYGAKKKWRTEILVGLCPKYDSGSAKAIITLKENFVPWKIRLNNTFTLEPLTTSLYYTTIISRRFWGKQPSRYENGYYVIPTKYRLNISLGQCLNIRLPGSTFKGKSITAYYELSTCDIYVLSAIGNKYLKPRDWLQLCIGMRMGI